MEQLRNETENNELIFNFFFLKQKKMYKLWKTQKHNKKKIKDILINIFILRYIWFYVLLFINI